MTPSTAQPDMFVRAVDSLLSVRPRPEIVLSEAPAPQRLAPFAYALGAAVHRDARRQQPAAGIDRRLDRCDPTDGAEVAAGRLILLYDPAGHEAWQGRMRLVTYVTAELESDLAADPLLPEVGWSWLVDALDGHGAEHTAIGGTVTLTSSTRFGELAGPPTATDIEIRASWTPIGDGLDAHLLAWCTLLASTGGLPPPGITALPGRSGSSGAA
jgi:hypothetical protein